MKLNDFVVYELCRFQWKTAHSDRVWAIDCLRHYTFPSAHVLIPLNWLIAYRCMGNGYLRLQCSFTRPMCERKKCFSLVDLMYIRCDDCVIDAHLVFNLWYFAGQYDRYSMTANRLDFTGVIFRNSRYNKDHVSYPLIWGDERIQVRRLRTLLRSLRAKQMSKK